MFGTKKIIVELENTIREQKMRNEQYKKEIMLLKTQLEATEEDYRLKEIEALKTKIQELTAENQALNEKIENDQTVVETLEEKLRHLNSVYNDSINQREKETKNSNNKIELLEYERESLKNENFFFKTLVDNLQQEMLESKKKEKEHENRYFEKNVKYHMCLEILAKKIFGTTEFNKNPKEVMELVELLSEEEYEKKLAYAKLCSVLKQIAETDMFDDKKYYEQVEKTNWYNLMTKDVSIFSLSRKTIIKYYRSWSGENYLKGSNLKRLKVVLERYGWKSENVKELVLLNETCIPYNVDTFSWNQVKSADLIRLQYSFSIRDIIRLFCTYHDNERQGFNNIDDLIYILKKMNFNYKLIEIEKLKSEMKLIYAEIIKEKESDSQSENLSNNHSFSKYNDYTYTPRHGTEYVSGHFRRRNGNIEWVRGHYRNR